MPTESGATGPAGPSITGVLPEVVKGLKEKPALLFGIGAGIILVVILGLTADPLLVLIVAAVLVLSLVAWVITEVRTRRRRGDDDSAYRNATRISRSRITDSQVGVIQTSAGSIHNTAHVTGSEVDGSTIGVVSTPESTRSPERG